MLGVCWRAVSDSVVFGGDGLNYNNGTMEVNESTFMVRSAIGEIDLPQLQVVRMERNGCQMYHTLIENVDCMYE